MARNSERQAGHLAFTGLLSRGTLSVWSQLGQDNISVADLAIKSLDTAELFSIDSRSEGKAFSDLSSSFVGIASTVNLDVHAGHLTAPE